MQLIFYESVAINPSFKTKIVYETHFSKRGPWWLEFHYIKTYPIHTAADFHLIEQKVIQSHF